MKTLTKRLTPTLGVYLAMIIVGLFLPFVALLGYLVLALLILVPFSAIRRRQRGPEPSRPTPVHGPPERLSWATRG